MLLLLLTCAAGSPALAGSPPSFSQPLYDPSTGSYFINVSATAYQVAGTGQAGQWNKLEILVPNESGSGRTVAIVLALPVEAGGTSTRQYGSAIQLIQAAGWHTKNNVAIVTPAFSTTPWFADKAANTTNVPVRQESYLLQVLLPYLRGRALGQITLAGPISLVGFSKSGWGAFSLIARNPTVFHRAALWDAPTMLSAEFCQWLQGDMWGMMANFGDCQTWKANSPVELVRAGAGAAISGRLWLGGQHYFGNMCSAHSCAQAPGAPFNHTVQFHQLLVNHSVSHLFDDTLDPGRHEWSWLWLRPAMDSLLNTDDVAARANATCPKHIPFIYGDHSDGFYCCSTQPIKHPAPRPPGCSAQYCCLVPGVAKDCEGARRCSSPGPPAPPVLPPYSGKQVYGFTIPVEVIPDRRDMYLTYHRRKPEVWWANLTANTLHKIRASAAKYTGLHFNVIVSYPLYHDWSLVPELSRLPILDKALIELRKQPNIQIHHYIMTRKGPPAPCCHCCSSYANITHEVKLTLDEFPEDTIFFDNGPFPGQEPLYTALYNFTQFYRPLATGGIRHVVMNGGRHTEAEERQYLALPSLQLMAFEGYASSWEDMSTPSYWREYPATRFAMCTENATTEAEMMTLIQKAAALNFGSFYVTHQTANYSVLPPYWEAELAVVDALNKPRRRGFGVSQ